MSSPDLIACSMGNGRASNQTLEPGKATELYSRLADTELFDYDHPQVRFGPCVNAEKEMNGHHTMEPFVLAGQLLILHTQGKVWPLADNKYSTVIIHTISREKL